MRAAIAARAMDLVMPDAQCMHGVLRTRVLVLVPLLGELAVVLLELPVILGRAWLACARVLRADLHGHRMAKMANHRRSP